MNRIQRHAIVMALGGLAAARLAAADDAAGGVTVLTALPVTYSIASALTKDTHVTVQNVPDNGRRMNAQQNYFTQQAPKLEEQFKHATAVVTIGKLWQDDPLFVAARSANIRVVNIDATKPYSDTLEGATVAVEPATDAPWAAEESGSRSPSVNYWLSPSNGARAADIVGRDLMRLAPADAPKIAENLKVYIRDLLALKVDYEKKLAALPDVSVYALGGGLVYLTNDMGIFVDGYFLKQDINWTDADAAAFTKYLKDHGIRVVIHQWDPSDVIKAAIEKGGAKLVVLDVGDGGIVQNGHLALDGYTQLLRANLEKLYQALLAANH